MVENEDNEPKFGTDIDEMWLLKYIIGFEEVLSCGFCGSLKIGSKIKILRKNDATIL